MCGRYTLTASAADIEALLDSALPSARRRRVTREHVANVLSAPGRRKYNIVPTSREPIVRELGGEAVFETAHWWLLPAWASGQVAWRRGKDGTKTFTWKRGARKSHFNSRHDTLLDAENRYWHGLLASRRCLVPADGFVEWPDDALRPRDVEKIPRHFSLHERRPFFFAGVWDEATDDEGAPFLSYNIVTVPPNELLRALPHHRMPALLEGGAAASWLAGETGAAEAALLLKPYDADRMTAYAVSNLVNASANESPEVLMPREVVPEQPRLF